MSLAVLSEVWVSDAPMETDEVNVNMGKENFTAHCTSSSLHGEEIHTKITLLPRRPRWAIADPLGDKRPLCDAD